MSQYIMLQKKCNKICMVVVGLVPVNVKNWHNHAVNTVAMGVMVDCMLAEVPYL